MSQPEYSGGTPRQVRWASGTHGGSSTTTTSSTSEADSEQEDRAVAYTINQYRSEKSVNTPHSSIYSTVAIECALYR